VTDTEEFRLALAEAVALPGEVRPRPGAGHALRARARRRRLVTLVAAAASVPACLVLVAILLGGGGPDARRATTPAGGATTSAPAATSAPAVSIAPGPRTLSTPIEIRPVLQEFLLCPEDTSGTVPAAEGDNCYRLGPATLTLHRLLDLQAAIRLASTGTPIDGVSLMVTMISKDAATFKALTTESVGQQLAIVVDGRVWTAPVVAMPITQGGVQIDLAGGPAGELIAALTG
jgi:hypothetical protein